MNFLIHAAAALLAPFLLIGSSIGSALAPTEPTLGASQAIPTTIAFFETTLASAISSSATSFTLTSATDKDGTTLASSTYAFVIDEGSSNEEIVIADCTATACVNAERGISVRTGNTEVAALKKAHRRGASVKMTDAPILPLVARIARGEGEVDYTPTLDGNLVTKSYVDGLSFGAIVAALETGSGFVELATALEGASSTPTGSTGASLVLQAKNATSTYNSATAGLKVVVTQNNGTIDPNFISTTYASTTALKVGDTPILNIGSYVFATTTAGTSTWSVPTGIKRIKVTLVGPGGHGGGSTSGSPGTGGSGGGAGAAAIKWYDVSATTTLQFHIGDYPSSGNLDNSWFGGSVSSPIMKATSGANGSDAGSGGDGGTATGGDLNFGGGDGDGAGSEDGGVGGNSIFGGGGGGGDGIGASGSGTGGNACGAGGGAGSDGGGGGLGVVGCLIIEY